MKFTKEQVFEKLKGELTKGGKTSRLTDRTINGMLDALIPLTVNDETELDNYIPLILPAFVTTNGNMEHDFSDFVKNYKPVTPPTIPIPSSSHDEEEVKALKDKLAELEKKVETESLEKTLGTIKSNLKSAMKSKGIKDDKFVEKYLAEIAITPDLDIEAKSKSALELYNLSRVDVPSYATPLSPSVKSTDIDKIWDDIKPKKD